MRCGVLVLTLILADLATASAAPREPPFEAVISQDEAFVRSGPGEDEYYPTQKLKRGDRVKVVRDDFGWYLIEPPAGSHSWIATEFVERRAGNKGIVTQSTFDRIGSELETGDLEVRHRIQRGETVEIIGEEELPTAARGSVKMYKIKPPRGEFRYISKRDVASADEIAEQPSLLPATVPDRQAASMPGDRGAKPGQTSLEPMPEVSQGSALPGGPEDGVPTPKVEQQTPTANVVESQRPAEPAPAPIDAYDRLKQADQEFRLMAEQPVERWNLAPIRAQYQQLREQVSDTGFQIDIDRRLAAVSRYESKYRDFVSVENLMRETEARDEQIRQQFISNRHFVAMPQPVTTRVRRDPSTVPQQWQPARPEPNPGPSRPTPLAPSNTIPPVSPVPPSASRFDGAGIVQRSALDRPGLPKHVLVAPNGRVLTYLQGAPGIDLDRFLGQPLGLQGERAFRPDLNADLLTVRRMTPVRLTP